MITLIFVHAYQNTISKCKGFLFCKYCLQMYYVLIMYEIHNYSDNLNNSEVRVVRSPSEPLSQDVASVEINNIITRWMRKTSISIGPYTMGIFSNYIILLHVSSPSLALYDILSELQTGALYRGIFPTSIVCLAPCPVIWQFIANHPSFTGALTK